MNRLKAVWLFPLVVERVFEGVLVLGPKVRLRNYPEAELRKLERVARECALGLYGFTVRRQAEEKAQAERTLALTAEQLRLFVDNALDVFYRYRLWPLPQLDFASPALAALTGYELEAFSADPALFVHLIHPEDRSHFGAAIGGQEARSVVQVRWRRRDGSLRWVEHRFVLTRNATGRIIAIEGVARDVTERVEGEEERRGLEAQLRQSQKLEALGTLAAGIAHSFGNLLTAIFAFARIGRGALTESHPATKALHQVEEAAFQARGVTRSLLTFTQHSSSERKPVNLTELIPKAVRMLRPVISPRIEMLEMPGSKEELWVVGDESQIHQILMNLIINARDAMPDGGILKLGLTVDPAQASVNIIVEDTGVGMTAAMRERIFEPFFTTKPSGLGTGLGLAVTHGIVIDHGGTIAVESTPGEGSCFVVSFPRCPPPQAIQKSIEPRNQLLRVWSGRLLIVAGDATVRAIMGDRLRRTGLEVFEVGTVETALEFLRESEQMVDLLLLDLDSLDSSALECAPFCAEAGCRAVLILTSDVSFESPASNVDVQRKPIVLDRLVDLIGTYCETLEESPIPGEESNDD